MVIHQCLHPSMPEHWWSTTTSATRPHRISSTEAQGILQRWQTDDLGNACLSQKSSVNGTIKSLPRCHSGRGGNSPLGVPALPVSVTVFEPPHPLNKSDNNTTHRNSILTRMQDSSEKGEIHGQELCLELMAYSCIYRTIPSRDPIVCDSRPTEITDDATYNPPRRHGYPCEWATKRSQPSPRRKSRPATCNPSYYCDKADISLFHRDSSGTISVFYIE